MSTRKGRSFRAASNRVGVGGHTKQAEELVKRLAKRMGMKYRHTKKGAELRDEWSNKQLDRDKT
jgi:hypothetical protein